MKKKYIIIPLAVIISLTIFRFAYNWYNLLQLRKYTTYESKLKDNQSIEFKYILNDSALFELQNKYHIASLEKAGSDVDSLLIILKWVHNLTTHTMNPSIPKDMSSGNLIKLAGKGKQFNCWMYATVFNELCLSYGFYSRIIAIKPFKVKPIECHIVNTVFIPSLNKWIFFDPTYNAYGMDENKNLLGLVEIREKIINNDAIVFNKDLKYVGSVLFLNFDQFILGSKKSYKDYLTKNIFRFECKMISKYNSETLWWKNYKKMYVFIPTRYKKPSEEALDEKKNVYTDDIGIFWQNPTFSN